MNFSKISLVLYLSFSLPFHELCAQEVENHSAEAGNYPNGESGAVLELKDPMFSVEPQIVLENSGPVEERVDQEVLMPPPILNGEKREDAPVENKKDACPSFSTSKSKHTQPLSFGDALPNSKNSSDVEKTSLIRQLLVKYGFNEVKVEAAEPAWKKLSPCQGGFEKSQCHALLQRSISDASQATFRLEPSRPRIELSKSWEDFKKAIAMNPGSAKDAAINESANPETHPIVKNFVTIQDYDDKGRLQVSTEAISIIDKALADGRGTDAKLVLDRLKSINPSAAGAINCLLGSAVFENINPEYGTDLVGPLSGVVYAKFKDSENGIVPALVIGGIAVSDYLAAAGAASLVTGGIVLLAEGLDKSKGYWHDITTGQHGPAIPPPDKKPPTDYKGIALGALAGGAVTVAIDGAKKVFDAKSDDLKTPKEIPPSGATPAKIDSSNDTAGNPTPSTEVPKDLFEESKTENQDFNPGPVKEWVPQDQLAEKQAAEAQRRAEELLQELSIFHFVDSADSTEVPICPEPTQEEKEELISSYVDSWYEAQSLAKMPIDFNNPDWNKLPELLVNECAVLDYVDSAQ